MQTSRFLLMSSDPGALTDSAASDPLLFRARQVTAALVTLQSALSGHSLSVPASEGRTYRDPVASYLRKVEDWVNGLDRSAAKLATFSIALQKAGERLPPSPSYLREACATFAKAMHALRVGIPPVVRRRTTMAGKAALTPEVRILPTPSPCLPASMHTLFAIDRLLMVE